MTSSVIFYVVVFVLPKLTTEANYPDNHNDITTLQSSQDGQTTTYSSSNRNAAPYSTVSSAATPQQLTTTTKPVTQAAKHSKRSKRRQVLVSSATNMSDVDSIRTEDIEKEFHKVMMQPVATSTGKHRRRFLLA